MSKLKVLDLFSGIGGFSLGLERTGGFETVAFCEIDPRASAVLKAHWPSVPVYPDVTQLTIAEVRQHGAVNVICGGFPCQDASVANIGGIGSQGERTGLFKEIIRLAREAGDDVHGLIMENVPNLLNRGFGDVLSALAEIGFDAEWECISARQLGADHERDRLWILAYPQRTGREGSQPFRGALGRAAAALPQYGHAFAGARRSLAGGFSGLRVSDGLSVGMERSRLHGLGNAVIPQIPELIGNAILASLQQEAA